MLDLSGLEPLPGVRVGSGRNAVQGLDVVQIVCLASVYTVTCVPAKSISSGAHARKNADERLPFSPGASSPVFCLQDSNA